MALPPLSVAGRLPLGRWPATIDEVRSTFVVGKSERRRKLWADWEELTEAVRETVGIVPAVWMGGSFLTDRVEPGDVDSVYVIESRHMLGARADPRRAKFIQTVADNGAKKFFGLQIDSFVLEWTPRSGTAIVHPEYLMFRGYWDDLWSRERCEDDREESIPRRGYLEVIVDGYS